MTYKSLYLRLVAAIDDALTLLEDGKIVSAIALLQKALTRAEEAHLDNDIISENRTASRRFYSLMTLIWQAFIVSSAALWRSFVMPAQQLASTVMGASGIAALKSSALDTTHTSV